MGINAYAPTLTNKVLKRGGKKAAGAKVSHTLFAIGGPITMSLPFGHVGTPFERFLQELPEDCRELALEFKAFTRSRKIKTPEQLLRWS